MRDPLPDTPPESLRVGVNLFPLALAGGGMRQYVLHLLPWMVRLSPHRFLLFHGPQAQPSVAQLLRGLRPAERNRVLPVYFEDQEQIFRKAHLFDVFFCPLNCLAPDLLDRPTLATLADVQERFFPHYFTPLERQIRAELYPHTAHAATVLLTISEFSKQSICSAFGVPPEKVVVTPLSPGVVGAPAGPLPTPEKYFFYPANFYPHKNHALLLDALRLLSGRGLDCACVLTGQPVQPGIDINREIAARGLGDRVTWLGHVAPAALRRLYEGATALAFPSQFEGFGLPLVEAMACGCPVVATPAGSIPEVVGDAALLVPDTPEAFADALQRIVKDAGLRADLIARGRLRAERFTPERVAAQTLDAIDLAVARFARPRPHGATNVSSEGPSGAMLSRPSEDRDNSPRLCGPRKHDGVPDRIMLSRPAQSGEMGAVADGPRKHGTPMPAVMTVARQEGETVPTPAPAVSYVIRPRRGGRALAATLAALAYEAAEQDEVLILAAPADLGPDARTLAANLAAVRFAPAARASGRWLDEVRRDIVCCLHEGDRPAEGAAAAALNAFAERPDAEAVVGQVLGLGRRGRTTGVRYRPPRPYRPESGGPAPSAAVFWKRAWLLERRAATDGPRWADRLLRECGERAHALDRTVAHVPAPRPLVRPIARALARRMPPWLAVFLKRVYRRMARPGFAPR